MVTERQHLTDEHLGYAGIRPASEFYRVSSLTPLSLSKAKKNINSTLREYSGFKILDSVEAFKGGD